MTTSLCYQERPHSILPPDFGTVLTVPSHFDHTGLCLPVTFRGLSDRTFLKPSSYKPLIFLALRFPYSHHQLMLYTHFCASPQIGLFGITYSDYRLPQRQYIGLFSTGASIVPTMRMWFYYSYSVALRLRLDCIIFSLDIQTHAQNIRLTYKYPCFALRPIRRISAVCYTSSLS